MDIIDLGRPLQRGMAQSPSHPVFTHALFERHGDETRDGDISVASDLLVLGSHVGTHIDAPAHISHRGRLHGSTEATRAQAEGFPEHGVHTIKPSVVPAILLDVPNLLGRPCEPGLEITKEHLEGALAEAGVIDGAAVLLRTGWGAHWEDMDRYVGRSTGVPGIGPTTAAWLASMNVSFVGSDTLALETIPPGRGHADLPVHRILLVEHAIPIIESLNLEPLAERRPGAFSLVVAPLPIVGATGSPLRPLALVPD